MIYMFYVCASSNFEHKKYFCLENKNERKSVWKDQNLCKNVVRSDYLFDDYNNFKKQIVLLKLLHGNDNTMLNF